MPITLDITHRPLFIVTLVSAPSDAEIRGNLAEWTASFFPAQKPYALVYDAKDATQFSPRQRQMTADWVTLHAGQIRSLCAGCSFVFATAMQRGVMTAVHWMSPPPYPVHVTKTRVDAIRWCLSQLQAAHMAVGDSHAIERW